MSPCRSSCLSHFQKQLSLFCTWNLHSAFVHCYSEFLNLFCTAILPREIMCNIMTKKSILHYALILFFKPSARWEMIDRFSKNLQLQGKGAAPATTTYASLEAKLCRCFYCCHNNRNSQDDDLESTMRVFHFCSTY